MGHGSVIFYTSTDYSDANITYIAGSLNTSQKWPLWPWIIAHGSKIFKTLYITVTLYGF